MSLLAGRSIALDSLLTLKYFKANAALASICDPCSFNRCMFLCCTLALSVVVLNALIAVISETFDRLQEHSEALWVKGQAQLTYEVELAFGPRRLSPYVAFTRFRDPVVQTKESRLSAVRRVVASEVAALEGRLDARLARLEAAVARLEPKNPLEDDWPSG